MPYKPETTQSSKSWDYDPRRYANIREVYRMQLKKFERLGLGGVTEFGTIVTAQLVGITERRYNQLKALTYRYNKKYVDQADKSVLSKKFIKRIKDDLILQDLKKEKKLKEVA
tara:strand:+ start:12787 stop:13125 length:339 start_codon:yes stop_codon:yes gene_type:complete